MARTPRVHRSPLQRLLGGIDAVPLWLALFAFAGFWLNSWAVPLFDLDGQDVDAAVVRRCVERGWAEPWFNNPLKPDWLVCKLTDSGRRVATAP